jgi:serine/threonine protein kinase
LGRLGTSVTFKHAPDGSSSLLPPGTHVDGWTVLDHHSQGSYGGVYRAVRTGHEQNGPVALKLALYPWDPRFAREGQVLSRIYHPSVPRLLDRGVWRPAPGVEHPYLIMEWIDGTPLYKWARQRAPSAQQVLLLLSQLAQALAATHAIHAVHRDVKGDNVLMRHSDGRAVLIDFGSCHYLGASRLTWQFPPPGTPAYHSPEAGLFVLRSVRSPFAYFQATPADDLFALGVTAYCLVMGEYPPRPEPSQDMSSAWHLVRPDLRPLLEHSSRVEPQVRECILRLLSMEPSARGTAADLAQSLAPFTGDADEALVGQLETALPPAPIQADASSPAAKPASSVETPLEHEKRQKPARDRRLWLAVAAMGLAWLFEWSTRPTYSELGRVLESRHDTPVPEKPEAGRPAAVGDSSAKSSQAAAHAPAKQESIAQDTLPKPQPRQARPDEKGHCPGPKQVPLNGLCWLEYPGLTGEECRQHGYAYIKGRCYAPVFTPHGKPQPTSDPPDTP